MQPALPKLIQRLNRATEERGRKSKLAAWLGVHRQCVPDWLSGKQEPGGEITLKLLQWVESQERQQ
jgi:DNA-binding transcriptional regulator YiaG